MKYIFYFDESFHDRVIKLTKTGELNTKVDNALDSYIGVFWGCKEDSLTEITDRINLFEEKYRSRFDLENNVELKSQFITKKNYNHGVRTFSKDTYDFYWDLFSLLIEVKPILQIEIISKMEYALRRLFDESFFSRNKGIIESSFLYSLTKFYNVYHTKELVECLFNIHDQKTCYDFKKTLIRHLDTVLKATKDIERKKHEYLALKQLYRIINKSEIVFSTGDRFDFSYIPNFQGLSNLLLELAIPNEMVSVIIDNEEKTYKTAQRFDFYSVSQEDSKNSIQIRLADWISGFIGRMIYALQNDEKVLEDPIVNINDIENNDLSTKRLLSEEWFDIREKQYDLYILMFNTFITGHEYYWTTMTTIFSDNTIMFYALLRYFNSYGSFENYNCIDPLTHSERYNGLVVKELEDYYKRM